MINYQSLADFSYILNAQDSILSTLSGVKVT